MRGLDELLYRFLRRSPLPAGLKPRVMAHPVLAPGFLMCILHLLEYRVMAPEPALGNEGWAGYSE